MCREILPRKRIMAEDVVVLSIPGSDPQDPLRVETIVVGFTRRYVKQPDKSIRGVKMAILNDFIRINTLEVPVGDIVTRATSGVLRIEAVYR